MPDITLLAPVPIVHLEDGLAVCQTMGKVAFGSRAWEVFRQLDDLRGGEHVPVLLYASMTNTDGPAMVSWTASYIGHLESRNGAHPQGMKFRPPSTEANTTDNLGFWAVFWEVENLTRLPENEWIEISSIQGQSGNYFKRSFIPEGPLIVQRLPC